MTNDASVRVRFQNPQYDPATKEFKLDVCFQSDTPAQRLFGMNVRFFYDATKLKANKVIFSEFANGYGIQSGASIGTSPNAGTYFGLKTGPVTVVNWAVQLLSPSVPPVYLSIDPLEWTKLWSVAFTVANPTMPIGTLFAPAIIWNTQNIQGGPGFLNVPPIVITTVAETDGTMNGTKSKQTYEYAEHFNWTDFPGVSTPLGQPNTLNEISFRSHERAPYHFLHPDGPGHPRRSQDHDPADSKGDAIELA